MKILIISIVLLLLAGPLRKPFIAAWRTIIPVIGGGILGLILAGMFVSLGAPAFMLIAGPLIAALMLGSEGQKWFHDNFPPQKG